jgi:DNA-binding MarR family transcriptional regulator
MVDMKNLEEQPLGYLMYRVFAVLQPAVTSELKPLGLTLPEFVCLRVLSMFPGQSNAELARHTNVSPQAMNNVLRGLQQRGAVDRPASVASGRALPAQLTRDGAALLKRAEAAVLATEDDVLGALDTAARRQLKRLLANAVD